DAMVTHPDIDKIAFTGHVDTAKLITKRAADTLKRTSFELGVKSPNVVFADCDMDQAVAGAFHAIYFHGGQCCTAGSRLFVEKKVDGEVVEGPAGGARGRSGGASACEGGPRPARSVPRSTPRPSRARRSRRISSTRASTTSTSGASKGPSCS